MQENKYLNEIFIAGIRNHEYYSKKHNRKNNTSLLRELKYFIWLIYVLILSPFIKTNDKKIFIVYADIHEKILKNNIDYNNPVYIGRILKNPRFVKNKNSMFSIFRISVRLKLFIKAIFLGFRNKIKLTYLAHWVDFYIIYSFIKELNLNEIVISGHFDRYATWISLICKKEKINLTIDQHGALEKVNLPYKIYANTLISFNENEEEYFKKFILDKNECTFIRKGFKSNVKFCKFDKKEKFIIGIASQNLYTNETLRIVKYLNDKYYSKLKILIYPHPREKKNIYNEIIEKYKNIEIITDCRYNNIDILFTYFSTIVYDYLQFDNVKIICYPPQNIDMCFFNDERVTIIKSLEEIETYIC